MVLCISVLCQISQKPISLNYCIKWPAAMQGLLDMAAIFALDMFQEAKMPCWTVFTEFDYFNRINIVMSAPFGVIILMVVGSMFFAIPGAIISYWLSNYLISRYRLQRLKKFNFVNKESQPIDETLN